MTFSWCESEYVAANSVATQGIWLSQMIGELKGEAPKPFKILVDKKSAISLSKNPVFHNRSKHIEKLFHYIRQCIANKMLQVAHVRSDLQLADIFTKSLGRIHYLQMRDKIGLKDASVNGKVTGAK